MFTSTEESRLKYCDVAAVKDSLCCFGILGWLSWPFAGALAVGLVKALIARPADSSSLATSYSQSQYSMLQHNFLPALYLINLV